MPLSPDARRFAIRVGVAALVLGGLAGLIALFLMFDARDPDVETVTHRPPPLLLKPIALDGGVRWPHLDRAGLRQPEAGEHSVGP